MNPTPINLIDVLTRASLIVATSSTDGTTNIELKMHEAIDRVAELIEADKAYDEAKARYYHAKHYPPSNDRGESLDRMSGLLHKAMERRAKALILVGGDV